MKFPHPKFSMKLSEFSAASGSPSYESLDSDEIQSESRYLETDSGSSMQKATASHYTCKVARYRERLRASGAEEVLLQLPRETIALLDDLKERQGLRNRSLALLQLIERGGKRPSRSPEMQKPTLPGGL